ncbi:MULTISPECIES: amidohydrolase family protein [unclassified Bradyrhizobium]|uniref:amidohydrolase family protein n=1 Tax=unclassified Bradyrhizobium TaxID=2631580 RepID=UPI001FFBD1D8
MILRNVEVEGLTGLDVRLAAGRVAEIGPRLAKFGDDLDGRGGALIPGLADHHIHIFGLAAQAASVDLSGIASPADFRARIEAAAAERPPGAWVRAIGYHETLAGELSREILDTLAPRHRLRVQHQTGSLWMLNSAGLAAVGEGGLPEVLERDAAGRPTGRVWRGDAWLRERIGAEPPPLANIGSRLASYGVTALTDASITTDQAAAGRLAEAHRTGELPQALTVMSGGALEAPPDRAFRVGAVKMLLDEHELPPIEEFAARIGRARAWRRAVAVHCVTAAELAVALAALETAGARPGDRIEHGGVIPQATIGLLKAAGVTVVTQSSFIHDRGDRYLTQVPAAELKDLYRCASLIRAGVPVAGSSDAPYASPDPWAGIAAAIERRTRGGKSLGPEERIAPDVALNLYLGRSEAPGGPPRQLRVGMTADLCLLKAPLADALATPGAELVRCALIGGEIAWLSP